MKAVNGRIICWSEGYSSKEDALKSIIWVKQNAPNAEVEEYKMYDPLLQILKIEQ